MWEDQAPHPKHPQIMLNVENEQRLFSKVMSVILDSTPVTCSLVVSTAAKDIFRVLR